MKYYTLSFDYNEDRCSITFRTTKNRAQDFAQGAKEAAMLLGAVRFHLEEGKSSNQHINNEEK